MANKYVKNAREGAKGTDAHENTNVHKAARYKKTEASQRGNMV